MHFFTEQKPIYLQLREKVETAILQGHIKENEMLPSIRKLAETYQLNPNTVSNALSDLLNEGYLYKKRGIGLFVAEEAPERLRVAKAEIFRGEELPQVVRKGKALRIALDEFHQIVNTIYQNGGSQ